MQPRRKKLIAAAAVVFLGTVAFFAWPRDYCRAAARKYDLRLYQCPDGNVLQRLRIRSSELRRGSAGTVHVAAEAIYTVAAADSWQSAVIPEFTAELSLVSADGSEQALTPKDGWKRGYDEQFAEITLPEVRDGDYLLRAKVTSKVATSSIDLPLPLYAPARVHVLTDRPLYEPGHEVKFRALVVRARDLAPIDYRPGTWIVTDPAGEVLLEEKAPAGAWGVVAGSFPLDRLAKAGAWTVTWKSGNDQGLAQFAVEPFTLPRFSVQAAPQKSFYSPGEQPVVTGSVTYSSGVPVAGATLELDWNVLGSWPPPTEWLSGGLPTRIEADLVGRFTLNLPVIPPDLQNQATLVARIVATDSTGDRVQASAAVLLSQDPIQVQAVTELAGGLVENANNRVYLRVTRPDGEVLSGATIQVRRAWAPDDQGMSAELDADGVARVQIDPGPPVNVVIPPLPLRPPPEQSGAKVYRSGLEELVTSDEPPLADQIAMERWLAPLERCGKWVESDGQSADVVIRVSAAGAITTGAAQADPLAGCVLAALRSQRLPPGSERVYALQFGFTQPRLPTVEHSLVSPLGAPEELEELFNRATLDARDCMPSDMDGDLPWPLGWEVRAGRTAIVASWLRVSSEEPMPASAAACLLSRTTGLALKQPAPSDAIGLVRFSVSQPGVAELPTPQPTIMKGYEFIVSAAKNGTPIGITKLRMQPGAIPDLRLRATPVLAKPGEKVTVELLRGPSFTGSLPEKLVFAHMDKGELREVDIDKKTRTATLDVPAEGEGWYEARALGQRALIYVRPASDLTLQVTPEAERYAPGAQASLRIRTEVAGTGAKAAVGLFGVDNSLSQLAPLPGPDALAGLRPQVTMSELAFAALDAQALALGRIRGQNAAEATILRVSTIPEPAALDVAVNAYAEGAFDPVAELTDRFYIVLAELYAQTRAWEASAPAGEVMQPATMAKLWNQALDAVKKRGERVDDAFGRTLRLYRLPQDLLNLTDPRSVVASGTRLPEDTENWNQWVARNRP